MITNFQTEKKAACTWYLSKVGVLSNTIFMSDVLKVIKNSYFQFEFGDMDV